MTGITRRWRPAGTTDMDWTKHRVEEALHSWFGRWMASPVDGSVQIACSNKLSIGDECKRWSADQHAGLRVSYQALDGFVLRALDLTNAVQTADVRSSDVFARLSGSMQEDLLASLDGALAHGVHRLTFLADDSDQFSVRYREAVYVKCFAKESRRPWLEMWIDTSWLPCSSPEVSQHTRSLVPVSMLDAVLDSPVHIEAMLGQCTLSARELRDLAVGDVLCTHHSLDSPAALMLCSGRELSDKLLAEGTPGWHRGSAAILVTHVKSSPE